MQRTKKISTTEVVSFECDCCHKVVHKDEAPFEFQEAHFISFTGGYDSVFGDMSKVEVDLCQGCMLSMIGAFARVTPSE